MITIITTQRVSLLKLTDIIIGKSFRIIDTTAVTEIVRRRLIDMGIMEGSIVSLKKALPFGGPCTIEVDGQWIAIRRKEANGIRVEALC